MKITKLTGAVAAVAVTFGIGAANVAPASAADNIKTFGEQERLNGPNSQPYIGYTVYPLAPSNDPVPHNGQLYAAKLKIDGFGMNADPMIWRFGARAESGVFYPVIADASNFNKLYFDVVGVVPNSVVWNDGVRDILCWIPGDLPLEPQGVSDEPPEPVAPPYDPFESATIAGPGPAEAGPVEAGPVEGSGTLPEAVPNPVQGFEEPITPAEAGLPGFNR